MKLLTKSPDINYLHSLVALLEANGVPAIIQGEDTARMITPFLMTEPGLWVYMDEQHNEALQLIYDNEYIVQNKIDVEEFYRFNKNIISDISVMNRVYIKLGLTVVGWLLSVYILLQILIWLST